MGLGRTLLRPAAYLAGLHASRQLRAFRRAHRDIAGVQERLRARLVQAHAGTAFGRDHGLAGVRTYQDFVSAVPIRTYEDLRPYVQRVIEGQTAALVPPGAPVLMFSMTSGTTGQPKHIPVTPASLAALRSGWNVWGMAALQEHPAAWLRPVLQLSSSMHEQLSPRGVPCGAISGLLAANQKRIVRRMYAAPAAAADIADPDARYYTVLRCAAGRDVAVLTTANPSSAIALIETGQRHVERLIEDLAGGTYDPPGPVPPAVRRVLRFRPRPALAKRIRSGLRRDGRLLPRHFWDLTLLALWTGGTLQLYLPRLGELFEGVPVRDIGLLASEGRFTVPLADGSPAGPAEITANFLEFIPADQRQAPRPEVLRLQDLQVDQEYFLVFSNWTGLMRYNLDDRLRVVARAGGSPLLEFLSRGLHTASITGEKITEHQVVQAMRRAAAGLGVERFRLQGRFAPVPHYELHLEAGLAGQADRLAAQLDQALGELNIEYRSKRATGRLGAIRPVLLPAGELQAAEARDIAARHGRAEQYKPRYLLTEVLHD